MKTDRRVKYTKMVLRESLISLLRDKPISRITIKELCEHADINRATFYAHYANQFDLLKKLEDEFIADITSYLDNFALEAGETSLMQMITKMLEYIDLNRDLCRILLGTNVDTGFQTNIMQIISERVVLEWQRKRSIDDNTADYIYTYVATGSIGIIRKWLFDKSHKTPKQMAVFLTRLANKGVGAFIV